MDRNIIGGRNPPLGGRANNGKKPRESPKSGSACEATKATVWIESEARKSDERSDGGIDRGAEYRIMVKERRGEIEDREGLLEGGRTKKGGTVSLGKGNWKTLRSGHLREW
jgi:hypothetical protein